jgi:hypothetical protein
MTTLTQALKDIKAGKFPPDGHRYSARIFVQREEGEEYDSFPILAGDTPARIANGYVSKESLDYDGLLTCPIAWVEEAIEFVGNAAEPFMVDVFIKKCREYSQDNDGID